MGVKSQASNRAHTNFGAYAPAFGGTTTRQSEDKTTKDDHKNDPNANFDDQFNSSDPDPQSGSFSSEDLNKSAETTHNKEKYYVPVSFVIQTEIENHDIFRDILQALFESIRSPQEVS